MTDADSRFAESAIRRRPLFLALSLVGIGIAVLLAVHYLHRRLQDPSYPLGVRAALVTLILLNARQNLRQYRYAGVLASALSAKEVGGRHEA